MNDLGFPMTDGPVPELPSPGAAVRNRLVYGGARGDLAKIAITNAILTLATLGIYRFWGKTRVRRYLWGRSASSAIRRSTPAPARSFSWAFWSRSSRSRS